MGQPEPFVEAGLDLLSVAFAEMRDCLADLAAADLNWRPEGEGFNSLTALAVHSLSSTRSWICVALGQTLPVRDRESEFRRETASAEELVAWVAALQDETLALVREGPLVPWQDLRPTHARPDAGAATEVTGAWALLHAIEHLREHVGQMWLTRQLRFASSAG